MTAPTPDRDAIRARLAAAHRGPWKWAVTEDRLWAQVWHDEVGDVIAKCSDDDDAALIAHAPTDIAALLDALDSITAALRDPSDETVEAVAEALARAGAGAGLGPAVVQSMTPSYRTNARAAIAALADSLLGGQA